MTRLSHHLAVFLTGPTIAGALTILCFALGFYSWQAVAISVVTGLVLAWPAGRILARRIKRGDPTWDARSDRPLRRPAHG
ncbi:hypothetical protein [Pelagovum pacificum]|uniref:Uncharacterized protein n=1 Tax=Pelagovum pacificum TaxID=2588711 RepID=A0A5C5GI70_9RHOB|nr:hypothetical protein [Pelagovum pacificum]QQA43292.1 hypothetical protein I8N54_01600 [Pelagovum pacificum]TNY33571.1 hypothetical protein FHY64_09925 [Pelagovum pacificum]